MAQKLNGKKLAKRVEIISILIVAIFLIIYLITIVAASPAFYTEMAARSASINFDEDMSQVSQSVEAHYDRLYKVVDEVTGAKDAETVGKVMKKYAADEQYGTLRYFSDNKAYAFDGKDVALYNDLDEKVLTLAKGNEAGCTSVYYDPYMRLDCIAFFVPVRGSLVIDGLVSVVPVVDIVGVGGQIQETTSMVAVIKPDGNILSSITAEDFAQKAGANVLDFFDTWTQNKENVDAVRNLLAGNGVATVEITTPEGRYTVVASSIEAYDSHLYLLTLSESSRLIPTEFDYAGHLAFVLIVAILALFAGASFAILFRRKVDIAIANVNLTDPTLDCPNVEGFKKTVASLLRQSERDYAVVVCSLKGFHFLEDKFGAKASTDLLKYIKEILTSTCYENEAFGYAGDGKFLLLVDFRNENIFRNRLLVLEGIINRYDFLQENQVKMQIAAGIYLTAEGKNRAVADMIDYASIVCEEARNNTSLSYVIYTDSVREKINENEHMEARMKSALSSNEFRLFLQPKYNVERDEVDSAEALVRWFDYQKGDYRYPAEFIGLFESNGFIIEMDHFIYLEVLKYLSEANSRGDKVVPISVNVSRVTAASSDFINFYVGNKNRYMIADDLITLEFTESYATEDYQKLSEIITALHEGGIRCSIDDFGVGYSSFRILKDLQMDELKMDRLFLDKGVDVARDDKIITTIIELAQNCGMTVVMEGVETKAMFDRVVQTGIGVIQGYYYAKAISLEEFKIFINSNTSIRYKSVVK